MTQAEVRKELVDIGVLLEHARQEDFHNMRLGIKDALERLNTLLDEEWA